MRRIGVTVAAAGIIGGSGMSGGCSAENGTPTPTQEAPPPAPTSSPAPRFLDHAPWPEVQACSQPGAYTLPDDPDPAVRCEVADALKDVIDQGEEVRVYGGTIRIGNVGLSGVCISGPFFLEVTQDGNRSTYLGAARAGADDAGAEVLTLPFQGDTSAGDLFTFVVEPGPRGAYQVSESGRISEVGTFVTMQNCQR